MKFKLTKHAKLRLSQRTIINPNKINLKVAKNKVRKRIREICAQTYDKNLTYFRSDNDLKPINIYVCKEIKKDQYLLITAFNIY